jgi:hypothetical protein
VSVRLQAAHHSPVFDTFKYASWPSKENPTFRCVRLPSNLTRRSSALWRT